MNVVLFTIIVVITSNLIRKITLNMLCSIPCCEVQQFFSGFPWEGVTRSAITTLKLKEVSTVNGMFPELQTALSIFQKQVAIAESGSPLTLFQLQDLSTFAVEQFCPLEVLSQDSERLHFRSFERSVGRQSEARQSLGQCMHRMQCLVAATRTYDVDVYPCMGMALYTYAW